MKIAILIDCWYLEEKDFLYLYKNIETFVKSDEIDAVVLSSYNCSPFEYRNSESIWYKNSKNFLKDAYDKKCKDLFDFRTEYQKTHNFILNMVLSKPQIAMHYDYELTEYFNYIDTIYLLGLTLDRCIKTRPLGWKNVSKLAKIRTKQSCVATGYSTRREFLYHETAKIDDNWKFVSDDIYELII